MYTWRYLELQSGSDRIHGSVKKVAGSAMVSAGWKPTPPLPFLCKHLTTRKRKNIVLFYLFINKYLKFLHLKLPSSIMQSAQLPTLSKSKSTIYKLCIMFIVHFIIDPSSTMGPVPVGV